MWDAIELQVFLTVTGHPNVVGLHGVFFSDGIAEPNRVMFVLEMCRSSLADYLNSFRHVFEEDRIAWSRDLCTGLEHMHASNVIHRDLKPANLLLQRRPGTGDVWKISHFGNSGILVADSGMRPSHSTHVAMQQGLCTLNYAAPEILQKMLYVSKLTYGVLVSSCTRCYRKSIVNCNQDEQSRRTWSCTAQGQGIHQHSKCPSKPGVIHS